VNVIKLVSRQTGCAALLCQKNPLSPSLNSFEVFAGFAYDFIIAPASCARVTPKSCYFICLPSANVAETNKIASALAFSRARTRASCPLRKIITFIIFLSKLNISREVRIYN
jgi:hypothetical protein